MGTMDGKEQLFAKEAKGGKTLWTAPLGGILSNNWGDGPRGAATVDGDKVYALGAKGGLICANVGDGKVNWRVEMVKDLGGKVPGWGYTESVLVDGDHVICTPGGKRGTLAAIDKKTGEVIWRSSDWTDGAQYASVVPAELNGQRQFIQLTQKTLAGVSARDGSVLWRNAWSGRTAVIPTPIVRKNEVYISSGYGAGCRKITIGDAHKVTEDYSNKNIKNHHGGVLLLDGHLYGYSDGRGWTCQNLKSGDVVWDSKKLGKGCVFYADNRLYCLAESSGTVALAGANTAGWKEHGRFKLEPQTELRKRSGRIWTHPVVANGVLYLRDQELLFAFDVKAR
jgi:outer membrane protein assembly factor BamB